VVEYRTRRFQRRYRALADKHEMISFYDVNIQYNLEELEIFESIEDLKKRFY
jgi:hypothetical protein